MRHQHRLIDVQNPFINRKLVSHDKAHRHERIALARHRHRRQERRFQQQRLCIARVLAVEPEVVLLDEPCSALDPIATARIEELMREIKADYTIVIVTHNMQQAARVSDMTAFYTTEVNTESDRRTGHLVEYNPTVKMFSQPDDNRTEQYVTGRFG